MLGGIKIWSPLRALDGSAPPSPCKTLLRCLTGNSKTSGVRLLPSSPSLCLLSPVNLVPLLHDHVFSNLAILFPDLSSARPNYNLIATPYRARVASPPPPSPPPRHLITDQGLALPVPERLSVCLIKTARTNTRPSPTDVAYSQSIEMS